jgi:hypothetical protein
MEGSASNTFPVEELSSLHERLSTMQETEKQTNEELEQTQNLFRERLVELEEQIRTSPELTNLERLAWFVALSKINSRPDMAETADVYIEKFRRIEEAVATGGIPIIIWETGSLMGEPRIESFVTDGAGLTTEIRGRHSRTINSRCSITISERRI